MKFDPISRRYFLHGLGTSVVALPFLESLLPMAHAAVAPANPLRRFICVCQPNGTYRPDWYPSTGNKSRMVQVGNTHREMKLTDVTGPVAGAVSHLIGPEFANLRPKMLLLENLTSLWQDYHWSRGTLNDGHQMASVLTGSLGIGTSIQGVRPTYRGPSVDQVIANSAKIYTTNPVIRALHLRVGRNIGVTESDLSFDYRNGQMSTPTQFLQPLNAFNAVFKVSSAPPPGSKDNLLVDQVMEQYKALRNNARASAADKILLDDHMAMVAQLQTSVQNMTCATAAPTRTYSEYSAADRSEHIDVFTRLLVAAIQCGATKVASLVMGWAVDDINFDPVLGTAIGPWHNAGHSDAGEASAGMRRVHQFFSKKVANLLTALDVPEPGTNGTYLDNCIVYFGHEQADHNPHSYKNRPVLIAGSGGGALQTNKYIDYSPSPASSRDYNRMLVTLLQGMGLSQNDYWTPELQAQVRAGFGDDGGSDANRALPLAGVPTGG